MLKASFKKNLQKFIAVFRFLAYTSTIGSSGVVSNKNKMQGCPVSN